jgi:hypothetical protein
MTKYTLEYQTARTPSELIITMRIPWIYARSAIEYLNASTPSLTYVSTVHEGDTYVIRSKQPVFPYFSDPQFRKQYSSLQMRN